MNAKKAKKLRKLARQLMVSHVDNYPDAVNDPSQFETQDGTVMNTVATVRGTYQYLKNPRQFVKRNPKKTKK
jgi:hypothetical protein